MNSKSKLLIILALLRGYISSPVAIFIPFFSLLLCAPGSSFAATVNWICTNSSNSWSDGSCWDSGAEPQVNDLAYLTNSAVSDITVEYGSSFSPPPALQRLKVDATGFQVDNGVLTRGTMTLLLNNNLDFSAASEWIGFDGNGTVEQSNGSNTASDFVLGLNSNLETSGNYDLSGGSLTSGLAFIGNEGVGNFTQSDGVHHVNIKLYHAYSSNATGNYDMSGGTLHAWEEVIGLNGTAVFSQDGGIHRSSQDLSLGENGTGEGTYDLQNGDLIVIVGNEIIGRSGNGSFTQSGGTNSVGTNAPSSQLILGDNTGADGEYNLTGGILTVNGDVIVGNSGHGEFIQTGGDHSVNQDLIIANSANSFGNYTLNGGNLSVEDDVLVGARTTGSFTQTGGTSSVANLLFVRNGDYGLTAGDLISRRTSIGDTGNGTFSQSGGSHTTDVWYLGADYGGNGNYYLNGGNLVAELAAVIGYSGTGTFVQSGGSSVVNGELKLGTFSSAFGLYQLNGGTLEADFESLGGNGSGYFSQTGGTNTVNELWLAQPASGRGTYNLEGGMLDAGKIRIFSGGKFNFTDGYLSVDNFVGNLNQEGGVMGHGDSPGSTITDGHYNLFTPGSIEFELLGLTGGSEYDQLFINGYVNLDADSLGGGMLDLILGFDANIDDAFTLLNNDGTDAILGSFWELDEGAFFEEVYNNYLYGFNISYLGGTGNDVVVTVTSKSMLPPTVPEPTTITLFCLGLLGLGFHRYKQIRKIREQYFP